MSEAIKLIREREQKLSAILNRVAAATDDVLAGTAKTLVAERWPIPPFHSEAPGEGRRHPVFVTARLRLLWAMRREALRWCRDGLPPGRCMAEHRPACSLALADPAYYASLSGGVVADTTASVADTASDTT